MAARPDGWAADFCLEGIMDSKETAKAMIDHYIALGAAKVAEERQWRELAAAIQKMDRGAVEGFPRRPVGGTSRRPHGRRG